MIQFPLKEARRSSTDPASLFPHGEARHIEVHGGVTLWVVVVAAVRAGAGRVGVAGLQGGAPFVATQQRRGTTHG
ncbi:hypothetical protein [Streptomyces sp. NPDC096153]|uniref:hypothetical protein n=1 Tax=Streptomyces sp. NPDC096153 TaxID=3155548 RepID=UPI003324A973